MKKMKKLMFSLVLLGLISPLMLNAQKSFKFGHVNTQEILTQMPESDTAKKKMEAARNDLEQTMEQMQVELNKKYEDYMGNRDKWSKLVVQTKEQELQELQQRIQNFQMEAEQDLQTQRTQLFQPVYNKLNEAIQKVGQENGFTYVFDVSAGAVVYQSSQSVNVSDLVLEELGIK